MRDQVIAKGEMPCDLRIASGPEVDVMRPFAVLVPAIVTAPRQAVFTKRLIAERDDIGFARIGPRQRVDLDAKVDDRFRRETGYGRGTDVVNRDDGTEGLRERFGRLGEATRPRRIGGHDADAAPAGHDPLP